MIKVRNIGNTYVLKKENILQIDLKAMSSAVDLTFIMEFLDRHITQFIHHCSQPKHLIKTEYLKTFCFSSNVTYLKSYIFFNSVTACLL